MPITIDLSQLDTSTNGLHTIPISPGQISLGPMGSSSYSTGAGISSGYSTGAIGPVGIRPITGTVTYSDLIIDNKSMAAWMAAVDKRLLVLVPNQKLLSKYEALQQAYDHYKTLEALLHGTEDTV